MDEPSFDVLAFLREVGRPASVATVTDRGRAALAMMWFAVEEGRLWFHSPVARKGVPAPFLASAGAGAEVAVMVATFDPPDDVRQVRVSGPARVDGPDAGRVRRIYERYVPEWSPEWAAHATSPGFRLWSMSPDRGMAASYPNLVDGPMYRWSAGASFLR